ncbi:hypothetical protein ACOME3_005894 [Neoechinorhynchus agilis]
MANSDVKAVLNVINAKLNSISKEMLFKFGKEKVEHLSTRLKADCAIRPTLQFPMEDLKESYYTAIMVDPDAPSAKEPKFGPWLHWIVHNISKNNPDGKDACTYFGPSPPRGVHRYVTLVFLQPNGKIDFSNEDYTDRARFKYQQFIEKYNLLLAYGHLFKVDSNKPE